MLVQPKAGKRRIKGVQYYQETKHFPLCLYSCRGHIHQGCRKVLLCRNNPKSGELAGMLPVSSSPHHSAPWRILFPETTWHFEEACRSHLPFKYCNLHCNQVQSLRTFAVWDEDFLNFHYCYQQQRSQEIWGSLIFWISQVHD